MPPLPRVPLDVIGDALDDLEAQVTLQVVDGPTTHTAIIADGLNSPHVPVALGRYLVGVVAGAVNEDARLSQELLAREPDSIAEVRRHVLRLIGQDNAFSTIALRRFRDLTRNPWIAEILAHALLVIRERRATPCLEGDVRALKQPHADPRRQGLDLIAIYDDAGAPGLAVGEAKASRRYGVARLREAAAFFESIDAGDRGVEIRAEVHALKHVLPVELRAHVADGFWRDRCCYLPLVAHCDPINESDDNEGFGRLRPPVNARRLVALRITDFYAFFDAVADSARESLEDVFDV
jgi:hypothetical protein